MRCARGVESITHYAVEEALKAVSLVRIQLETGRTHQIRVHMSATGHPCAGDSLYGCDSRLAQQLGLERQWLHATELSFTHPVLGEPVHYRSEFPEDLAHALSVARAQSW